MNFKEMMRLNTSFFQSLLEMETWLNISEKLSYFGPFYGISIAMLESFFPPLPLALFVTINVMIFGPVLGYLYSWIGTCLGASIVYLLLTKFGRHRFLKIESKYAWMSNTSNWVKEKGGMAIFLLLCFPFTPSIAVAVIAALTGIKKRTYYKALIFGKMIMVFILSIIGYNIHTAIEYPIRLIWVLIIGGLVYFLGKKFLDKHNMSLSKK